MTMAVTTSCNPISKRVLKYKGDYIGMRFGKLTVVAYPANERGERMAGCVCRCDCGTFEVVKSAANLLNGAKRQCSGCDRVRARVDGKKRWIKRQIELYGKYERPNNERIHSVWVGMLSRCEDESNSSYCYYGEKGVEVCAEWHDYETFRDWAYAHGYDGETKSHQCTIDRINPYGNYEPSNCRWATPIVQGNNFRYHWDRMTDAEKESALATAGTYVKTLDGAR